MIRRELNKLFYSIFVRVGKQYGGTESPLIPALLTTLLLSVTSFQIVLSVVFVLHYWCDVSVLPFLPNWLFYGIGGVLMIVNYFLFIHKKLYMAIIDDCKGLNDINRKKETLPYYLCFLLASFSLVIVGFIYLFFLK